VVEQMVAALSAPHIVQAVWDRVQELCPKMSEPELACRCADSPRLWRQLFPVEQCRLAQLLIERVVIADGGLEIVWRDQGWQVLAGELMPGTLGAELQELEESQYDTQSQGHRHTGRTRVPRRRAGEVVDLHPAEDPQARRQQGGCAA
jgi:hypothetical protein